MANERKIEIVISADGTAAISEMGRVTGFDNASLFPGGGCLFSGTTFTYKRVKTATIQLQLLHRNRGILFFFSCLLLSG